MPVTASVDAASQGICRQSPGFFLISFGSVSHHLGYLLISPPEHEIGAVPEEHSLLARACHRACDVSSSSEL